MQIIFDGNIETLNKLREDTTRILEHPRYQLPEPIEENPEYDNPDVIEYEDEENEQAPVEVQGEEIKEEPAEEPAEDDRTDEAKKNLWRKIKMAVDKDEQQKLHGFLYGQYGDKKTQKNTVDILNNFAKLSLKYRTENPKEVQKEEQVHITETDEEIEEMFDQGQEDGQPTSFEEQIEVWAQEIIEELEKDADGNIIKPAFVKTCRTYAKTIDPKTFNKILKDKDSSEIKQSDYVEIIYKLVAESYKGKDKE